MLFTSIEDMATYSAGAVRQDGDAVVVENENAVRTEWIDRVLYNAALNEDAAVRAHCCWLIRTVGQELGIILASIQDLYAAKARGEYANVTVPAINIRGFSCDTSRAILRAIKALDAGPVLFEIARSEMGYTFQAPHEYTAHVMAGAIKEGYRGPLFIQGDHFQVKLAKYNEDPAAEVQVVKDLIAEAIDAGFFNIDVDTSTLVDLGPDSLTEQQRLNFENCAVLTRHIRELEPAGVTVSIGGEIGEVGKQNSTPEELRAYADGLDALLGDLTSISKISVQTGTAHGGIPMPDGSVASVALDFDVLAGCTEASKEYGMAGAVQHGASTLPDEAFHRFAECDAAEVHLATGFQNILFDGGQMPQDLKDATYTWLKANVSGDRKPEWTDEQFYYKTRKKGFGPFKKEWMELPTATRDAMAAQLEEKFLYIFEQLGLKGTRALQDKYINPVRIDVPAP